jgi:hypothetical protein
MVATQIQEVGSGRQASIFVFVQSTANSFDCYITQDPSVLMVHSGYDLNDISKVASISEKIININEEILPPERHMFQVQTGKVPFENKLVGCVTLKLIFSGSG